MTEKEKKILSNFEILIPKLTDLEKEKLISFGEGLMLFKAACPPKDEEKQKEG